MLFIEKNFNVTFLHINNNTTLPRNYVVNINKINKQLEKENIINDIVVKERPIENQI